MTALSRHDLGVLLQRGDRKAVTARLHQARTSGEPQSFMSLAHLPFLLTAAEDLQMERQDLYLRLHHGPREVLRRTPDATWLFPKEGGAPRYSAQPHFDSLLILRTLIEPYHLWAERYPLAEFHPGRATTVTVTGRPALRIPVQPAETGSPQLRSVDVDSEHGVILAADTAEQRIGVAEIDFPDTLPDPTWTGPVAAAHSPTTTGDVPARPEQPGVIRIRVDKWELHRLQNIRVGEQIRVPLRFTVDATAPDHLRQTVRGHVSAPHDLTSSSDAPPRWRALLLTDDWYAQLDSPMPLDGEVEVTGVLEHGDEFGAPAKDLAVDKLFLRYDGTWHEVEQAELHAHPVREMLVDSHPVPVATPPAPRRFLPTLPAVDETHLWLADRQLPVARCWSLDTGAYAGQVLVPTTLRPGAVAMHLFSGEDGAVASADGARWALRAGEPVAAELPTAPPQNREERSTPALPAGWVLDRWFDDDLFAARAMPPLQEALAVAVGSSGPNEPAAQVPLCRIDPGSSALLRGFRLGEEYFFTTPRGRFRLNARLQQPDFAPWGPVRLAYRIFNRVVVLTQAERLRFFDRESGAELTSLAQPESLFTELMRVTPNQILVLRHTRGHTDDNGLGPQALLSWSPHAGWRETPLAAGPGTLYQSG